MGDYAIVRGPMPEALGRIVEMHDAYYAPCWGFGSAFTSKNVEELTAFLGDFDPEVDGLWILLVDGRIEGSIAIDGPKSGREFAELRWFLVSDALRGVNAGSRLLDSALAFCRDRGFGAVSLWTFAGLDDARRLYDRAGFELVEQIRGSRWGTEVLEQRLELVSRPGST